MSGMDSGLSTETIAGYSRASAGSPRGWQLSHQFPRVSDPVLHPDLEQAASWGVRWGMGGTLGGVGLSYNPGIPARHTQDGDTTRFFRMLRDTTSLVGDTATELTPLSDSEPKTGTEELIARGFSRDLKEFSEKLISGARWFTTIGFVERQDSPRIAVGAELVPRQGVGESDTSSLVPDSVHPDLADALYKLGRVRAWAAHEEEYVEPSDNTLANAEKLLRKMFGAVPRRYFVYPMSDGEVAIDAPSKNGDSVIVYCNPDGSVWCSVDRDAGGELREYDSIEGLPDAFLCNVLAEMSNTGDLGKCL